MSRKPGTLLEIFGDFWLGVAGAGARGFAHMTEKRREEKAKKAGQPRKDFFETAAEAAEKVFQEAAKTAEQTRTELKQP